MTKTKKTKAPAIQMIAVEEITPSYLNDQLYHCVDPKDPAIVSMAESMRAGGVHQPLTLTREKFIASGHRRFAAAKLAGLKTVPCIVRPDLEHGSDEFMRILRECNMQRIKTFDERLREEVAAINTEDAYEHLKEYRRQKTDMVVFSSEAMELGQKRKRKAISDAKRPFLQAIEQIIEENRENWPLSDRQIHYRLLNDPPLTHASKPESIYENTERCYKSQLVDLLTRARIAGDIPWAAIADETRPFTHWTIWREPGVFIREQAENYLQGYWRDLLQSQPHHVEIVAEKLTVKTIVENVAQDYTIPVTIGRGFSSLDPRHKLNKRFAKSGRDKLIIVFLSDFDPDGESIAESFARSMRDDFQIPSSRIHPVKCALTNEQVQRFNLPRKMTAKKTSSRYEAFSEKYGDDVWELEALEPKVLAGELRKTIDSVIDREALEHEREQEVADAGHLEGARRAAIQAMGGNQ